MKCCIISTLYPPNIVGGAEKVAEKLATELVKSGHDVTAITLHGSSETKNEMRDGVNVYYLPIDNIYWPFHISAKPSPVKRLLWHLIDMWNFKAAQRVGKIFDKAKPDILYCHNLTGFSVAVWAEAKKRGIKIVHTLHDYSLLCPRGTLMKHGKMCQTRCAACAGLSVSKYVASHMVDDVVGVSRFVASQHMQRGYFKNAKQSVIYNSCELPVPIDAHNHMSNGTFTFGFIGRVEQEKGIDVLLEATTQLPNNNWRLLVAGRGLDAYVEGLKIKYPNSNIEWLGFVEPNHFYTKIDVLIVPSIWPEPFPLVIAEASARNIPVIISDMGGMPEYLNMGVHGVCVSAGDVSRLAHEMRDALAGSGLMAAKVNNDDACRNKLSTAVFLERYLACYKAHS
ncbi:MAG: glycosyltransferase family 4 protein [Alphaproteobacteria bacterium]|nr:glycosyltransferase family 4 protein [Alphaproteobacteria bacterium]